MPFRKIHNQILLALGAADRALLSPSLEQIALVSGRSIKHANRPIKYVYFPDSGTISVVVKWANDQIEIGIIGREGMSGTAVVLGNHRSPNDAYVQMAGSAHRIAAHNLRMALETSKTLRQRMERYTLAFMVQVAQTAFANGRAKIEGRLTRLLLMLHDRQDGDDLHLTQASLAVMLGVRRTSVTLALQELESKGLICATRGIITIMARKELVALAGGLYGVPESEYDRLLR